MLLTVENLHVAYGAIRALHGVSLAVDAGQIVALIGSNGAGKTTLLRAISGLLALQSGRITLDGAGRIDGRKPHRIVRAGVSHVPEGRQIFPLLTVRENLLLGGYTRCDRGEMLADVDRCCQRFPILAERRDQKAGTLSGGEQQMLAIARALMARPRLLLLDEPSLGLAPLMVRQIFQIVREINAAGTTVFLVEQNAHMALTIAHRGYVMQTGEVIKSDTAARLLQDEDVKRAYLGG